MNECNNIKLATELHNKTVLRLVGIPSYLDSLCSIACEQLDSNPLTREMVQRWTKEAKNTVDISIANVEHVIQELRKV